VQPANSSALAATTESLYAHILRGYWAELPEPLRVLHGAASVEAAGLFTITVQRRPLARLARFLARLPAPASNLPVTVHIERDGMLERWRRTFGRRRLATRQTHDQQLLVERYGPLELTFCLGLNDPGTLEFHQTRAALRLGPLRLSLHRRVAPTVYAHERVLDCCRIGVLVTVSMPLAGEVIRYEGWIAGAEPLP
jgi:hypothetical protein